MFGLSQTPVPNGMQSRWKARESEAPSKDERVSIALQVHNVFHNVLEIARLVKRAHIALFRPPMAASGFERDRFD